MPIKILMVCPPGTLPFAIGRGIWHQTSDKLSSTLPEQAGGTLVVKPTINSIALRLKKRMVISISAGKHFHRKLFGYDTYLLWTIQLQ
jgi:hypothetical protein